MKKYLYLASVCLSVFLTSQSVEAMDKDLEKDLSSYSTIHRAGENKSNSDIAWEEKDFEQKKKDVHTLIRIGMTLYEWFSYTQ